MTNLGYEDFRETANFTTYVFFSDKLPISMKMLVFFLCSDRRKNHGCGQKKKQKPSTTSAIFGIEIAAKCCELKRYADRVRGRTDNKDEVLKQIELFA